MHKCGAETDAGKCSRLIGNKFKFCHEHRPSRTTTYGGEELDPVHQETRKEIIKMLWDDSKELMKMWTITKTAALDLTPLLG